MDGPFPFSLPLPTAFYESLIMLTWAAHALLAQFVLGGTLWLAWLGITRARSTDPVENALRDWLPFGLGLAITLGVAPLLFLQIVDKQSFYTANLLGSHRFMAMLPALIVGFYLLYVLKSWSAARESRAWRIVLPLLALAAFGFTALSWTENHLLAQDREAWSTMYGASRMRYTGAEVLPRAAFFAASSLVSTALVLTGFVRSPRRLSACIALACAAMLACAARLGQAMPEGRWSAWTGDAARPWVILGAASLFVSLGLALRSWWNSREAPRALLWCAWLLCLLCISALREVLKLHGLELGALEEAHRTAFAIGGFEVFLIFAALAALLLFVALRRVARDLKLTR